MPLHLPAVHRQFHAERIGVVGTDECPHLIAQRQRVGRDGQPAALLLHLVGRHRQTAVDHGKGSAVFELLAATVLDAYHFRREHRETRTSRLHHCLRIGHGIFIGLRPQRQQTDHKHQQG